MWPLDPDTNSITFYHIAITSHHISLDMILDVISYQMIPDVMRCDENVIGCDELKNLYIF